MADPIAVIGTDGLTKTPGFITVYTYGQDGCYSGSGSIYRPVGVSLPPNSTVTAPPAAVADQIAVWSGSAWAMQPDYRGQVWYLKSTGVPTVINAPGTPDAAMYSSTPVAGSAYLKSQASAALTWCSQQASLASMMGQTFTADMKTYVAAVQAIVNGTDTTSTTLPTQPTDVMGVASTSYALTGAATATVGTALTLTITPDNSGPDTATTVTLSDGSAGGTFSSDTVTLAAWDAAAQTVTYTPKAAGAVTISATNTGGLTNPASLSITVAATS